MVSSLAMLKDDHVILTTSRVLFVILILILESVAVDSSGYIPNHEMYGSFPMDISLGENEIQGDVELAKRGWNNFNAGYGKRAWNSFNGGFGKRSREFDVNKEFHRDFLAQELGSNYLKRAWNSGFAGGMGKRAWNSGFQGGMGKRAWNSGFVGGIGKRYYPFEMDSKLPLIDLNKRAWNSGFAGGLGKRAWNSGFAGGMGKRERNSDFEASLEKRSLEALQDAGDNDQQDISKQLKRNWSSLGIRGAWGKRSMAPTPSHVIISPSNFRALQENMNKRTNGWLALRGLWGKRSMSPSSLSGGAPFSLFSDSCFPDGYAFSTTCKRSTRAIPQNSSEELKQLSVVPMRNHNP